MASSPALIVREDGRIEATPELNDMLHAQPGTRLELIDLVGDEMRFRLPSSLREVQSWRNLPTTLADSSVDLNEERAKERHRELEREADWRV